MFNRIVAASDSGCTVAGYDDVEHIYIVEKIQ